MIQQGLLLMVLGMGMVFIFLGILICSMNALAYVVKCLEKKMPEAGHAPAQPTVAVPPQKEDQSVIAAVIAAASRFSKKDN